VDNYKTVPTGATEEVLHMLKAQVASYNLNEYQSKEIEELYIELLRLGNVTYSLKELRPHLDKDHVRAYNYLRMAL
jgi:hypothetical protein